MIMLHIFTKISCKCSTKFLFLIHQLIQWQCSQHFYGNIERRFSYPDHSSWVSKVNVIFSNLLCFRKTLKNIISSSIPKWLKGKMLDITFVMILFWLVIRLIIAWGRMGKPDSFSFFFSFFFRGGGGYKVPWNGVRPMLLGQVLDQVV